MRASIAAVVACCGVHLALEVGIARGTVTGAIVAAVVALVVSVVVVRRRAGAGRADCC